jgi:hypothetical protein
MPVRDDPRAFLLPPVAPLTEALAFHLARPYVSQLPQQDRPTGRPSREEGGLAGRQERLLHLALRMLTPAILEEQKKIFELLAPVVQEGELTRRWLRNELEKYLPEKGIVFPERLREWHRENLLLYTEQGEPEANSTAALLIMRRLDRRRQRGWLPPHGIPAPQSFVYWRQDAPELPALPYELPLVLTESQVGSPVYKPHPEPNQTPYILWTFWKGAFWDEPDAWMVTSQGAIRWEGQISNEQAVAWLKPHEHAMVGEMPHEESIPRKVLRVLAQDRLIVSHS